MLLKSLKKEAVELDALLSALRDYAKAAYQLGSAPYLKILEEALAMTLEDVAACPVFDQRLICATGISVLRDYLKNWLTVYNGTYTYSSTGGLTAAELYVRCTAVLNTFDAALKGSSKPFLRQEIFHLLGCRLSGLVPQARFLRDEHGSTLAPASVLFLNELESRRRENEIAPIVANLHNRLVELAQLKATVPGGAAA